MGRSSDRERARRAGDLLCWSLRALADPSPDARDRPPSAAGLDDLTERAEYHRITPVVHSVGGDLVDLDPAVAESLEASYHYAVRRHLFVLDDLAWVAATLAELAPDVLVIKGPVLASVIYARPDLRSYGDLDIVVRAEALARSVELLTAAGAVLREPDWDDAIARRLGEVSLALPSGTILDLHWHLIPIGSMRDRFHVPMDELFDRARTVTIDGRPHRTLGAEDTVVHLALHAVLCGGDRLGWIEDLRQSLDPRRGATPDPAAVVSTARAWGAIGALTSQVTRLERLFGPRRDTGSVPTATSTTATVARLTTALADRIQPPERSTGEPTIGVALAWAAAPTAAASAVALAGMGARWVRRRGAERPVPPPVDAVRRPPTPGQWQAYLAAVGAG